MLRQRTAGRLRERPEAAWEDETHLIRKLSPDAQQLVEAAALDRGEGPKARGETEVLVRTRREVSSEDQARIKSLGVTVLAIAGDVLSARIPIAQLQSLADLDVVVHVEISQPLRPQGQAAEGSRAPGE